ncbi:HD-GYP domain-containing protein [Caloranaerobacter ferrireducens]|uniref:HD-GYP domain-containing protein n=1 Tax=Caloranaerobacter ferrireducens TaxID=1323370 RepID=UPI00084D82EE|nr:HD domain-containing protein [Caloranaerobacter ferrireducens]
MRLYKVDEKIINKRIAVPIKSQDGRKLISEGTQISERLLKRLKDFGLNAVYIEDDNSDVKLEETISEDKRIEIIKKLNCIYQDISKNIFNESELNSLVKNEILNEIGSKQVSIPIDKITNENSIAEHSLNVCLLSIATGKKYGLNMEKVEILAKAALLHDIGKIIKNNKNNLRHEQIGFEFLKSKFTSVLLYTTVRYHHETIDGNGPQKQPKARQHDLVKILSLANHYENLIRKEHLMPHECFEKVQALVNVKYDNEVFEAFRKSIHIYPVGLPVKLNNQELGIVIRQNNGFPLRPFVRTEKMEYNLLEHLSLFIEKVEL